MYTLYNIVIYIIYVYTYILYTYTMYSIHIYTICTSEYISSKCFLLIYKKFHPILYRL